MPRTEFVPPANLARLVVDGLNHSLFPDIVIGSGPTERAIRQLREINAITRLCVHDEQAGRRIETGRTIVGEPAFRRGNQASIARRLLRWIRDGAAPLVNARGPVYGSEGHGQKA